MDGKEIPMNIYRFLLTAIASFVLVVTACSSDRSEDVNSPEPELTGVVKETEQHVATTPVEKELVDDDLGVLEVTEVVEASTPENEEPEQEPDISESYELFDVDSIVQNLDDYVLRSEDLPNQYRLLADGEQHNTNLKVLNTIGQAEGKRYIAATSRLDGWSLELERVNKLDFTPYTILSQVEVFDTAEGARTAFGPDWFHAYTNEVREPNWIENGCDLGDSCLMYYYEKIDPATELVTLQYEVAFVYNNVLAQVLGRGLDFDYDPEYVVEIAEILFEKIDSAPKVE
jgi:hypothetical protein